MAALINDMTCSEPEPVEMPPITIKPAAEEVPEEVPEEEAQEEEMPVTSGDDPEILGDVLADSDC